jgi:hypothetical protein
MNKAIKVSVRAVKDLPNDSWANGPIFGEANERDMTLNDIEQAVSDALESVGFMSPVIDVEVVNR